MNVPPSLDISIAMAVRWWNTVSIAWWRRFRAFIKATKHRHRASTCSDIIKGDIRNAMNLLSFRFQVPEMARSMRPYAHTRTCRWSTPKKTHKTCEGNIGRHLKKKKKERQKCSNAYTFFTLRSKKSQPYLPPIFFVLGERDSSHDTSVIGPRSQHNIYDIQYI